MLKKLILIYPFYNINVYKLNLFLRVMVVSRLELMFDIKKSEIGRVLDGNAPSPDKIYIASGNEIAKQLGCLDGLDVSFALVANPHKRFRGAQRYTIGFVDKLKLKIVPKQNAPIILSSQLVEREKDEFRNNGIYDSYSLFFVSPPVKMLDFCLAHGAMAPYATPDA